MDKSKNLQVSLDLVNEKLHFNGQCDGQPAVSIDYVPPLGDNLGYTSLELLLLSLSSCMASALLLFIRRMGKTVNGLSVLTEASRQSEHPTILTIIHLRFYFQSPDLLETEFEKVLAMAEEKYCPVFAMINSETKIITTCHISRV